MATKEELQKKIQQAEAQQKQAEANFHRLAGAIVVYKEQLAEFDKPKDEPKTEEKSK